MIKKLVIAAALMGLITGPAAAGILVNPIGMPGQFAAPAGPGVVWDFNTDVTPAGFSAIVGTGTGYTLQSNSNDLGAQPAYSDGSRYLAVQGGGTATLQSTSSFDSVSWFMGSIDDYNTVSILDRLGGVIASFTGVDLSNPYPADGNQSISATNRRITFTREASDPIIGGISFASSKNSAEVDNVVFAVPEPATWIFMLLGFGVVGVSMRARSRRTNAVLA